MANDIFQNKNTYQLPPAGDNSMIGAGVYHNGRLLVTHSTLPHKESALQTTAIWQKLIIILLIAIFLAGLIFNFFLTVTLFVAIISFIYFLDMAFNLFIITKSLHTPVELNFTRSQIKKINDETLPVYSLLCPLYKEAEVLPHFLRSIKKLNWPKEKLDVLLLLEENDKTTIDAAYKIKLPPYVRVIIVPESEPKTKPKACNLGLALAIGEYLVVYDAEDRPESSQLKKAYLGFQYSSENVVCLQAKLNYYNSHQNLLTKLFTAEYSLWFDIILSGLQTINTIIPLGGTSNHFKKSVIHELSGWDPFNVTEDCDLGVRLFKKGYKTSMINSTTYEEANSKLGNWLRQRSRWIKGYLQTYLVHTKRPWHFYKSYGLHALIFQLIIGARITFIFINPVLWIATISYFTLNSLVGPTIERLYPGPVFYVAAASAVFGNFMYVYNYMLGCAKRGQWGLIKYVYLIPFYWLLAFVAGCKGVYQLIVKPHYWEKTVHGYFIAADISAVKKKINFNWNIRNLLSSLFSLPFFIL